MTTTITTPTDDEAYPAEPTTFDRSDAASAPLMFSPESTATAGQFDTEADRQR